MAKQEKPKKNETESLLITVQDNAVRTSYVKTKIDQTQQSSKYMIGGDWE